MDPTNGNTDGDLKTFRGRTLEEVLPRIRAELGPDAIVLRRREGLGGGVGGFFQRPYVEVDARAPQADARPLEIRSDRATAAGLASAAVQALFEQATPFADALAAAAREARSMETEDTFAATMAVPAPPRPEAPAPAPSGLYGPQPNATAIEDAAPREPVPPAPQAPRVAEVPPAELYASATVAPEPVAVRAPAATPDLVALPAPEPVAPE